MPTQFFAALAALGQLLCTLLPRLGRAAQQVDHQRVDPPPLLQASDWTPPANGRLWPNRLGSVRGTQATLLLCPQLLLEDLIDALGARGRRPKATVRVVLARDDARVFQALLVCVPKREGLWTLAVVEHSLLKGFAAAANPNGLNNVVLLRTSNLCSTGRHCRGPEQMAQ